MFASDLMNYSLGAPLAASWLNTILFTGQVLSSVWYLANYKPTPLFKYGIYAALLVDTAATMTVYANAWLCLLRFSGSPLVQELLWIIPVQIILTCLSAAIEQTFFLYRYWTISSDKLGMGTIILFMLAHKATSIATALYFVVNPTNSSRIGRNLAIAGAACGAVTDIYITVALAYRLHRVHTPSSVSRSFIRRTAVTLASCGVSTAILTTLIIILLLTNTNGWFVLFGILGRVYSLTVICNLMILNFNDPKHNRNGTLATAPRPAADLGILSPIYFDHGSVQEHDSDDSTRKNSVTVAPGPNRARIDSRASIQSQARSFTYPPRPPPKDFPIGAV